MKNRVLEKWIAISVSFCMIFACVVSVTDYGWAYDSSKGCAVATESQGQKEQKTDSQKDYSEENENSVLRKTPKMNDEIGENQSKSGDENSNKVEERNTNHSDKGKESNKERGSKKEKETRDSMPRKSFHKTASNGVTVTASVDQGVFPKGTTMSLAAVSSDASEKTAATVVGNSEKVQDAIGVDITFIDKNGHEIQPAQGKSVSVSMSFKKAIEGEHFTVLHQSDDGSVSTVGAAGANGASFQANSFSIYIISGQGNPAIATYRFHDADGAVISNGEQKVKDGETLYSPKTPEKEGYIFTGWAKTQGADAETVKAFKEQKASVEKTETIDLYPVFKEARYIFFMDQQGRVADTETGLLGESVNTADVKIQTESSSESVVAWYRNKALTGDAIAVGETVSFEKKVIKLYPKTEKGNYVYFDTGNDGTYIEPAFVPVDGHTVYPKIPKRPGYAFKGWSTKEGAASSNYFFGEEIHEDLILHAVWEKLPDTGYTVVFWKQSVNDQKDAAEGNKTYDYVSSEKRTAPTESQVAATAQDKNKNFPGFTFNSVKTVSTTVNGNGTTVLNVYYDRNLLTINFYTNIYMSTPIQTMTGLYGQTLAQNGYRWPEGKWTNRTNTGTLTFLDSFLFDNLDAYGNAKEIRLYKSSAVGFGRINHFKQNVDGSWSEKATNSTKIGINGRFLLSNKYRGFTVSSFSIDGGITWYSGSVNQSVSYSTGMLDVRYKRNSYNLDFYNYNTTDKSVPLTYGKSLLGNFYTPTRPEGLDEAYQFKGWFKDKSGTEPFQFTSTMPTNDMVAYAKWEPPTVHGLVHLTMSGEGIDNIALTYGEPVEVGKLPTVVDATGHVVVQGDSNYKVTVPNGYKWLGWATKNGKVYKRWNFKTKVQEDLELYPYYVSTEKVKVTYDVEEGSGNVIDEKGYLEGSEADVQSGKNVTPPTGKVFLYWKDDSGDIYYEGDSFVVTGNMILHAVYGDAAKTTQLEYQSNYPAASGLEQDSYKQSVNGKTDLTNNTALKVLAPDQAGFTVPDGYYFDGWESTDGDFTPGTNVGVDNLSQNIIKAKWVKKENLVITVTGNKIEKTYNGLNQSVTGYTTSYELKGKTITVLPAGVSLNKVTKAATGKDVGAYPMNLEKDDFSVTGANSHKYSITIKVADGQLKIKKTSLKITTDSDTKEFDGTPLTNKNSEINGLKGNDGITVTTTGSQTDVGSSKNEYTIAWGNTKKDNYEIESVLGTLKVTAAAKEVELKAAFAEKTYDGTALTNSKVTWTGLPEGYKVEASAKGSQKDAGTIENVVADGFVIRDKFGKDVTGYFANVKKVNGTLRVTPKKVVLTSQSATKEYDGTPLERPTVTGQNGFVDGEVSNVTATGTVTEEGQETNTIAFTKNAGFKDSNYDITKNEGTLRVTKNMAAITVTANSKTKTYDGRALSDDGSVIKGLPAGFTATVTVKGTIVDVGTVANTVKKVIIKKDDKDVTAQFGNVTVVNGTLIVAKRKVTLTSNSDTKAYDGKPLENAAVTIGGDGFVAEEVSDVRATGSITKVGSTINAVVFTKKAGFKADNYSITKMEGTLTVTKSEKAIVVTAPTKSKIYDGEPLSAKEAEVTLPAGFEDYTVEADIAGSVTDVEQGDVSNKIVKVVVRDPSGSDVTDQFKEIVKNNGTLNVTPKAVNLVSESANKEYDGTALERPQVAGQDAFVAGQVSDVVATGSITEEGSVNNTIAFKPEDSYKESNYSITKEEGTLTIRKNTAKILVTAASDTKMYDGKPLTNDGYVVTGLPEGFTVTAIVKGSAKNVKDGNVVNKVVSVAIKDRNGKDVTTQFANVTTVDGKISVTPRRIHLKSGDGEKKYNGKPLTNKKIITTGDGWAKGEGAKSKITGSRTKVGTSKNTFTYTLQPGTDKNNYIITIEYGNLKVTKADGKSDDSHSHGGSKHHKKPVDTGDESQAGLLALLMGLSAGSFAFMRRRKEER